ncbi:CHAT domain-containing protein [Coleofasciculus sp. E2-BRE-01]|uniref:CHAT domain-containing protein n=1 Tax=Coleofasciculus sp. E2-BRE-01 TaxID=3069524 RepID=UPI003304F9BA
MSDSLVCLPTTRFQKPTELIESYQKKLTVQKERGDRSGEATSLKALGIIYHSLEQYQQAIKYLQQSLIIDREIGNQSGEASSLLNLGNVYLSRRQYPKAIEFYQSALTLFREVGDRSSESAALKNMGMTYFLLRQYSQAIEFHQQSLTIKQKIGAQKGEADVLGCLGGAYNFIAEYEKAIEYFQQALTIFRELSNRPNEADSLTNLGVVYFNSSQYKQAIECHQQALTLFQEIGDRFRETIALNNLGNAYNYTGQYPQAIECYQQVLTFYQKMGNRIGESAALDHLGSNYNHTGQYQKAIEFYLRALNLAQEIGEQQIEAVALHNLGAAYNSLGQYEQAIEYFQQSLTIARERGNRTGEARSLNNLGATYGALGQRKKEFEFYLEALTIYQQIGDRNGEAGSLLNLGGVWQHVKEYQLAIDSYQQSLTIQQEIGDRSGEAGSLLNLGLAYSTLEQYHQAIEFYQQALTLFREIGDRKGEAASLLKLGGVHRSLEQYQQAIEYYQLSIEASESIQGEIKIEELKTSFAEKQVNTYELLINQLWRKNRIEEAFNYVERSRARAFLDQIANGAIDFRTGANPKLLKQEEAVKAQITALRTQLSNLLKQEASLQHEIRALHTQLVKLRSHPGNQLNTEAIAAVQKQLDGCEKEHTQLLTHLKLTSPEVASLVSTDVATLEEIQSLLEPDTTLVEYFITKEVTLAFIITRESFDCVGLDVSRQDITKKIEAFRRFTNLKNPHPKNLQHLYEWLLAPLKKYLTTSHLTIVSHGILHYLPFAALTDGTHYLSEDYTLTSLPSASVLRFLPEKRKPNNGIVLALGNPTTVEPLPALHYAEKEVNTIAQLYNTQALIRTDATETTVFSQAGNAGILHLAAHGKYNPHNPLFSTLYLAPDDQRDGRLEVHEIYGLDLSAANLVVLSACQTQLGKLSKGDELVGLNRAFLYAGTPSVIGSLWSVNDQATGRFMEKFYSYLQAGMSKAEALRQAQNDIRQEYSHPYYWAAFVLTGDGTSPI